MSKSFIIISVLAVACSVIHAQMCPGNVVPMSSCSAQSPCQQSNCQCMQLSPSTTGCCPMAQQQQQQQNLCPSGQPPLSMGCGPQYQCQPKQNTPCQCSTLSGGAIGCCATAPPAAQMQMQPMPTPAPVMMQATCPTGVAPLCSCNAQNDCTNKGCSCVQLSQSGASGCCPQSFMAQPPAPQMQPMPYQQPLCPGTNQAPVSQCGQGSCPQFDCQCAQLNTGATGCCQQANTAAVMPAPVFAQPQMSSCPGNAQPTGYCNQNQQCSQSNCACNTQTQMCCPTAQPPAIMPSPPMVPPPMMQQPACPSNCQAVGQCTSQCSQTPNCFCNQATNTCCQQQQQQPMPQPMPMQQPSCPSNCTPKGPCTSQCTQQSGCFCNQQTNTCCQQQQQPQQYMPAPMPVMQQQPSCPGNQQPVGQCSQNQSCQQSNCYCNTATNSCCPSAAPAMPQQQQSGCQAACLGPSKMCGPGLGCSGGCCRRVAKKH